jgi:DNA invertase Pin-like site-specific DNA recombinase
MNPTTTTITTEAAALYARLSREDKDGKHAGCDSISVQEADGADAIRSQGWSFNPDRHTFEDDDVSGTKVKRRGWDALLVAAERREFSVLVVRDIDRIARYEPARAMATLIQLLDLGVRVWTYKERSFVKLEGTESILTYVKAIAAQQYSKSIQTNVLAALRRRALEGRAVKGAALGYRVEDQGTNGKRWVIDPAEKDIVLRVARTFIETRSFFGAARRLNKEGIPSPTGRGWRPGAVRMVITRPLYRGVYKHAGDLEIPHPELRIWTPEMEAEIDVLLARPTKAWGNDVRHMGTRLVKCGECGSRLVITGALKYLSCDRHLMKACTGIGYKRESLVDAAILEAVGTLFTDERWARLKAILRNALEAQPQADTREAEIDRLRREVATAERRARSLTDGVAEAEDATARGLLLGGLRDEGKRLEGLRAALRRAEAASAPASPNTIFEEAERRVEALRATLALGGVAAAPAVEAVLGGQRFTAIRVGKTWELTAKVEPATLFHPSSTGGRTAARRGRAA